MLREFFFIIYFFRPLARPWTSENDSIWERSVLQPGKYTHQSWLNNYMLRWGIYMELNGGGEQAERGGSSSCSCEALGGSLHNYFSILVCQTKLAQCCGGIDFLLEDHSAGSGATVNFNRRPRLNERWDKWLLCSVVKWNARGDGGRVGSTMRRYWHKVNIHGIKQWQW